MHFTFEILILALAASTQAAPIAPTVRTLTSSAFDAVFLRPAQFARIAYCSSKAIANLQCGAPCGGLAGVKVLKTGGDGGTVPLFYIASDSTTKSVVVAHQGTDSKNILSIANDAKFGLVPMNPAFFPKAGLGVQVHDGFQEAFEQSAATVLSTVQSALASTNFTNVLVTGHSLGAAIATMDALMLRMRLPATIKIRAATFGTPRGGNQQFANLIDTMLGANYQFVTNQNDPVPTVPPTFLEFQHPQGENHILATNAAGAATNVVKCIGQENPGCSRGNSIFDVSLKNHAGPYLHNISMAHKFCPL